MVFSLDHGSLMISGRIRYLKCLEIHYFGCFNDGLAVYCRLLSLEIELSRLAFVDFLTIISILESIGFSKMFHLKYPFFNFVVESFQTPTDATTISAGNAQGQDLNPKKIPIPILPIPTTQHFPFLVVYSISLTFWLNFSIVLFPFH